MIPRIIIPISNAIEPLRLRPMIRARVTSEKPNSCKKRARNIGKSEKGKYQNTEEVLFRVTIDLAIIDFK